MATAKTRRHSAIACVVLYFLTIPFLILVLIGNTHIKPVLTEIYFFRLDVSDIIPLRAPNAQLLNSIARSLGLHDFYQVGLWNFCEGYKDEGVTYCSPTQRFYWFNPVEILTNELLAGATIALPSQVNTILTILRIGQQIMFGFFLTSIVLNFVLMLASPLVLRSRWWSLPVVTLACITGILVTAASAIATVMSLAARFALTQQSELNIRADIGVRMFVFMWLAAAFTNLAFLIHAPLGCCCGAPERQQKTEETKAQTSSVDERKKRKVPLPAFMRRRTAAKSQSVSPTGTRE